jgi:hypothetical protein
MVEGMSMSVPSPHHLCSTTRPKTPNWFFNCITRARTHANEQMTDGMQESYVPGATGSASGPGWWTNCEEVFRMEG